jgi:hypothetical protein
MVARDMVSNPWSFAGVALSLSTAYRLAGGVSGCRGADAASDSMLGVRGVHENSAGNASRHTFDNT